MTDDYFFNIAFAFQAFKHITSMYRKIFKLVVIFLTK